MRCFIAIDIDDDVKEAMVDLQEELQQATSLKRGDVRWVRPEAMHLTLRFLGETPDERVVDLCAAANQVAQQHEAFDLDFNGVGQFGGRSPRVLWTGVTVGAESLEALHSDLDDALENLGWPKEGRRFSAHLTLCRIKNPRAGYALTEVIKPFKDYALGLSRIDTITVYQSELHKEGPTYTALGHALLETLI